MRSALIGNGVIIQHGGADYLNASIIQRALDNVRSGRFPAHLYPKECVDFVVALQQEHASALNGDYDKYVYTTYDRASLSDFKSRYDKTRKYSATEIGFEDYFLLFELTHKKLGITNPERFNSRGVLRRMFLDSVFNQGNIETVHQHFSTGFVKWLKSHDHVFTTNYDSNVHVFVMLLEVDQLARIVAENPFPEAESEPGSLVVGFLGTVPEQPDLEMLEAVRRKSERFALCGDVFYFYAPEGFHKTKLGGKLERALGVGKAGTGRTLGTLLKVMAIANDMG